jgi:hypothetical protein
VVVIHQWLSCGVLQKLVHLLIEGTVPLVLSRLTRESPAIFENETVSVMSAPGTTRDSLAEGEWKLYRRGRVLRCPGFHRE